MRKGTVYTHDTRAGSPGRGGRWGTGATNDGGRGTRDRKGVRSKLSHSSLCLASGGAPAVCTPQSVLGPLHGQGGGGRKPLSALQQALGSQAVLRSRWKWPRGGGHHARGIQKSGTTFPPRTPSRQGALFLVSAPKRGGEGLGVGPCHPGLFSGQELGIKIDYGGRNWDGRELRTHAEGPWSSVPMLHLSQPPGPTLNLGCHPRGRGSGKEQDN